MPRVGNEAPSFLEHGGETGRLIAAHDWSATALGSIANWPQSLRTATALLLRSPVPIVMLWGRDGIMLYNDAYSVFAGARHPRLLGCKVREGWPEVAEFNDHVMKVGLAGGTLAYRDQELTLYRHGRPEQVWMNLDYSPVIDESGEPAGVVAIVVETTERVLAERRSRLLDQLSERLRATGDPIAMLAASAELLGDHLGVDRVGYGEIEGEDSDRILAIAGDWNRDGSPSIAGHHRLADHAASFIDDLAAGRPVVFADVVLDPRTAGAAAEAHAKLGIAAQIVLPLVTNDRLAALLFVHSRAARQWNDDEVRLARDVAERSWFALSRARAEQALRENESRMRLALVAGGFTDWYWDARTDRIRFSPRAAETLKIPGAYQPTSRDMAALVPEEEREAVIAAGRRGVESGEPYQIEYRMRRPDGSLAWIATFGQPVRGDDGEIAGVIGISQEITGRKRAEEALREREEQLSAFISQTTAGFAQVDLDGRFTLVNQRFCEIAGRSAEDLMQLRMQEITHPDDLPRNLPMFERAVREGIPYTHEKRYIRPDGAIVWVSNSVAVIRRASGEPFGVLAVTLDVTERRRAEEALRKSEESLRLAVEGAGMSTWDVDLATRHGHWSGTRFDMLGLPRPADLVGAVEDWLDRIHELDRPAVEAAVERCFTEGVPFTIEYRIHRADNGEERWLHSYGNRIVPNPGEPPRFVGISFDITARKRSEQHQMLLIHELNHRVKNTLAIVQAIAHQSFKGEALSTEARQSFEGRLAALSSAHNLLTRQNWEGATIRQVIDEGMAAYRSGNRLSVTGPDLPLAPKAAVSLAMAVHELATNAVKYGALSTERGRIAIDWSVDDRRLRWVWRESGGPAVTPPARRGFGSRMIERGLAAELRGEARMDFAPDGLVCALSSPLPATERD
jgi:PAS domain S-box-containing protein